MVYMPDSADYHWPDDMNAVSGEYAVVGEFGSRVERVEMARWHLPATMEVEIVHHTDVMLEVVREDVDAPELPPVVNTDDEVARWASDIPRQKYSYPLMRVRRDEAPAWILLVYLLRLCFWRVFLARKTYWSNE